MKAITLPPGVMARPDTKPFVQNWVWVVVWTWVTLLLSADLKGSIHPYVHWFISAGALVLMSPVIVRRRYRIHPWSVASACVLVFSVVLSSFRSADPLHDLGQVAKLLALLLVAPALFNSIEGAAEAGFGAFLSSAYINVGFLLLGNTFLPTLAGNMAAGRWGTWLNYPGSLWKVGITVIVYATYSGFASRFKNLHHLGLLVSSLTVIYFDGSRTAILLLVVSVMYLFVIMWLEGRRRITRRLIAAALTIIIGLSMSWIWSGTQSGAGLDAVGLARFTAFMQNAWGGADSLVAVDAGRVNMLVDAVAAIKEHPFLGTGIGTTRSDTEGGPMVVHNAYLQVWADLGLLGLLGYVGLVLGWVSFLPRVLPKIRRIPEAMKRGLYYNAIFVLIYFAVSGLFHPLSTEWSEWITFIVPYALLLQIARAEPAEVLHG